ncbi:MAG TPA: bifunctional DNA-binding transcriptional regulator/O6-methylguanine-DNA methyltransferase Ada [Steroidobacteraceae bacterium]|nr:bifunctional DNA-binding transcriptional regulator/O6-methylguanine-DNA methyltransferase Ada [Steroidobacteraceae bacterium]
MTALQAVRRTDYLPIDGSRVYAVKSTGIYCRPGCPSRRARPENILYFDSAPLARAAGFRPCRRCNPDGCSPSAAQTALIEKACRMLESSVAAGARSPSMAQLAAALQLSSAHLHRLFKRVVGVTPAQYARGHRAQRARHSLRQAPRISDALYEAGYGSSSRFYAESTQRLGMTPRQYRGGGAREQLRFALGECSLGSFLVAVSARGVAAITLGEDPQALLRALQDMFPQATLVGADAGFEALVSKVVGLIDDPQTSLDLPLDVRGTAFQQRVWKALQTIPGGRTVSYAQLARQIGRPAAVRAVAAACAANRIAVAIPCHRVVRSDGSASGYRWGIERKAALLKREQSAVDWEGVRRELDAQGWSVLPGLLSGTQCADIAALYQRDTPFRSRVVMSHHGFGRGEYRYFAYPLPPLIEALRTSAYAQLVPLANAWYERMGDVVRFPSSHREFLARCHAAGQTQPTPLLLQYGAGDYNCLHQDLYGEQVFPLQLTVLLSAPGRDFAGGEFIITEQRPRTQSRPQVISLAQGDAVIFAVNRRPVRGSRGDYQVRLRHGVSALRRGRRHTLGIIFHDAA